MTLYLPSIHDDSIPPLESGGVIARRGFSFQDHVAVQFCLEMLADTDIQEVRCESQDDITLVKSSCVEYIQVKANEPDQLWTVALLCQRKKSKDVGVGTSIYERSLANDHRAEPSRFRIVTSWPVNKELKILTYPFTSPLRTPENHQKLCDSINKYANDYVSKKKNGAKFWVANTLWEIANSMASIQARNIGVLHKYIEENSISLTLSQIENIYGRLLQIVKKAADEKWEIDPNAKKIKKNGFIAQLGQLLIEAQKSSLTSVGKTMQNKMEEARLPVDSILAAHKERDLYRMELLKPKYLEIADREKLEYEIDANLHHLRAELDTGKLPDSGIEFHRICLDKLKEIQESSLVQTKPSLALLHGYMYYITGRCSHRFRKTLT